MNAAAQIEEIETAGPTTLAEEIRAQLVAAGCDPKTLNVFDALVEEQNRLLAESAAFLKSPPTGNGGPLFAVAQITQALAECLNKIGDIADQVLGPVESDSVPAPQIA